MTTKPNNEPDQNNAHGSALLQPSCSPDRVEWQRAILHPADGSGITVPAWQLCVNGRVLLNAVAMAEIQEAVLPEDRKLIGQAIAEYLANADVRDGANPKNQ